MAQSMKVVAIVSQKGGTSKTTAAINLAVEATSRGLAVVIVDLDPQVSASDWRDMRTEEAPLVSAPAVPHLGRAIKAAREAGADLVIVDTAGRTNDAAAAAVREADLVMVPLQPSLIDLKTLGATLEIIRISGSKPTLALLTRVRSAGSRHTETEAWLRSQDVDVCPATLGERVIYQDAYAAGKGVAEIDPHGKAAEEIRQVYEHTCRLVGLSERSAAHVE